MNLSDVRSFTSKKQKTSAAEIRRQVAGQDVTDADNQLNSTSRGIKSIGYYLSQNEPVQPLDVEEFLSSRSVKRLEIKTASGRIQRVIDYNERDITTTVVQRNRPFQPDGDPALKSKNVEPFIQDLIASYSKDFLTVERNFQQFCIAAALQRLPTTQLQLATLSERQIFETDLESEAEKLPQRSVSQIGDQFDLKRFSSVSALSNSLPLDEVSPLTLQTALNAPNFFDREPKRGFGGRHLMSLLADPHSDEDIERRYSSSSPPNVLPNELVTLRIYDLHVEPVFEPLFASAALYDPVARCRLTENFYFDCTSNELFAMIRRHSSGSALRINEAAFEADDLTANTFLVVRVEKVLQGTDIGDAVAPYMAKERSAAGKEEKLAAAARDVCERLGAYRMPIAWTFVDLKSLITAHSQTVREASARMAAMIGDEDSASMSSRATDTQSVVSVDRLSNTTTETLQQFNATAGASTATIHSQSDSTGDSTTRPPLPPPTPSSVGTVQPNDEIPLTKQLAGSGPIRHQITALFKCEPDRLSDDDVFKVLVDSRKNPQRLQRLKQIPVELDVEWGVRAAEELQKDLISAEDRRCVSGKAEATVPKCREIAHFPQRQSFRIHQRYRNLLYIYPKSVNVSARAGNYRNICVRVQLLNAAHEPQRVFFGRSATAPLADRAHTAVLYHNKTPQFADEIKCRLPADLCDGHYLLFTLLHISCKAKATGKEVEGVETPIGYTWHPLFARQQLHTIDEVLPISLEPPAQGMTYLSPTTNVPNIKWLDDHRPLFSVRISALSTVHPQDPYVVDFLRAFHSLRLDDEISDAVDGHKGAGDARSPPRPPKRPIGERELQTAVTNLAKAAPETLFAFLCVIFDKLLALIASPPFGAALSQTCFDTLCQLTKLTTVLFKVRTDQHGRSHLLADYIQFHAVTAGERLKWCGEGKEGESLMDLIKNYERSNSTKVMTAAANVAESSPNRRLVHEELARLFVQGCGQSATLRECASTYAWFFTELILKSVAEYLSTWNRLILPRRMRLSAEFAADFAQMCDLLAAEAADRAAKNVAVASAINAALAFFIRDAFSLLDRTFLMQRIQKYNEAMVERVAAAAATSEPMAAALATMKLDFARIVASHEHYVVLNLPFDTPTGTQVFSASGAVPKLISPITPTAATSIASAASTPPSPGGSLSLCSHASTIAVELSINYRSKHYIAGCVLADLAAILNANTAATGCLAEKAIRTVRSLLVAHESDDRMSGAEAAGALRARVAALYLPLIAIVMDARPILHDPHSRANANGHQGAAARFESSRLNPKIASAIAGGIDNTANMSIVGQSAGTRPPIEHNAVAVKTRTLSGGGSSTLSRPLTAELLHCFCWVLRNVDPALLLDSVRALSLQRLQQFVDLLQLCVQTFEYKAENPTSIPPAAGFDLRRQSTTDADLPPLPSAQPMGRKPSGSSLGHGNPPAQQQPLGVRWRGRTLDEAQLLRSQSTTAAVWTGRSVAAVLERDLCAELSLTIVETIGTLVRVIAAPAADHFLFILPNLFRVLMQMLSTNQSVRALETVFVAQRSFVQRFADLVFEQQSELCAELCIQLLRHLASPLAAARAQSAASLHQLMRLSYERAPNFPKVKMQITMAMSTLVSSGAHMGYLLNENFLRRSLKTLHEFASADRAVADPSFANQVKHLIFNLHMILTDTVKMRDHADDFEMLIDLMYRIAKGYANNPDLRLTWLINIANKHAIRANYAEAAQCMLHCAALSAEFQSMRDDADLLLPTGAAAFDELSVNAVEESATSEDVVGPEVEGICESAYFTADGLVHLVEKTADFLEKAQMYELVPQLYKVIQPHLTKQRNIDRLIQIHQRIADALQKVDNNGTTFREDLTDAFQSPLRAADKRCFGTYFRVGFYGNKFADLDGEEFIYKEPFFTKLSEISHRLEGFYTSQLGAGTVEVIKDSNDVDRRALNPAKAYLQVTFVEPQFDTWEKRRRQTHFERNYSLNRFVYATPFTRDGRPHGQLRDQYKRRTILTTEHYFPYLKTRIRVTQREQKVLSPMEMAMEDLQRKTRELAAATRTEPADAKMLQMVLQGCIGTTVNQGPIEIAKVFLAEIPLDADGNPLDRMQNKLRLCFKDFSKKCSEALQKNETLVSADQHDYQKELRKNYAEFTNQLAQILVGAQCAADLQRLQFSHSRADKTLPVNLHAFTAQVIGAMGSDQVVSAAASAASTPVA